MSNPTYLFVGASSAIAQAAALMLPPDARIIALSTKAIEQGNYAEVFQVPSYSGADLPAIETPLSGLVYFPGSINLKPFRSLKEEDFLSDYRINALGAVACIQKYLSNLKAGGNASVVLISTVAVGKGMSFHASIAMAKGAVEGLGRSLAAELAPQIRVNVVAPSLTDTPLANKLLNTPEKMEASANRHPLKKVGDTGDIASAITFLLQDSSKWITGQVLHVDGGLSSLMA